MGGDSQGSDLDEGPPPELPDVSEGEGESAEPTFTLLPESKVPTIAEKPVSQSAELARLQGEFEGWAQVALPRIAPPTAQVQAEPAPCSLPGEAITCKLSLLVWNRNHPSDGPCPTTLKAQWEGCQVLREHCCLHLAFYPSLC